MTAPYFAFVMGPPVALCATKAAREPDALVMHATERRFLPDGRTCCARCGGDEQAEHALDCAIWLAA